MLAGFCSLLLVPAVFAGDSGKKLKKMDTDGDGRVSRTEHSAAAQKMFNDCDTNQDGFVTATEMEAKADHKSGGKEAAAKDKFLMIDRNSDGRLTPNEHATGSVQMFDEMDTNRDGFLSEDELSSKHKAMKKNRTS